MFKNYTICEQKICIEAPDFPGDCSDWRLFETSFEEADISVNCHVAEKLPDVNGDYIADSGEFSVYRQGNMISRKRGMGTAAGAIACYDYLKGGSCQVYFTDRSFRVLGDDRYFWSTVSLAQLLLPKQAVLMHASFINVDGSAVLFSAPSGTGKSTQAELWRVHRNAEVINGDKAGVYLKDGKAFAGGVPFCGTSKICHNKNLPLKAIVLLSQGKENMVKRLSGFEALQGVINNMYLDLLAPLEKQMCIDFAIELLNNISVFSLECTPDERAIEELEKAL